MIIDGEVIQDHREIMKQEGHPRVKLGHSTNLMPLRIQGSYDRPS